MKSARFFIVVFLFSIFVAGFFANKAYADVGRVNPPANSNLTGPGYFFTPTPASQTVAKYGTNTINGVQTSVFVHNTILTEIITQLSGEPKVTLANGKEVGGSRGAIGFLSNQIAFMTTTPVISGGDFVAYNFQKLTVPGVKPTYAAEGGIGGVGYRSLFPVLQLWTLMRNIAYLFFAIIFVVVGLLIILGKKLDAKNAIAIQTALPKIVISLILVTFSYAIAGFVIDIMYVVIALIFSVLGPLLDKADPLKIGGQKALFDSIKNGDIIFIFFAKTPWFAAAGGVQQATVELANQIIKGISFGTLDNVIGKVIGGAVGTAGSILINLILVIAVFYALFKIWLKLIMTYIQIILAVIVGPFVIMMDAIPKPNKSYFMDWLKGLLGNAMIYPVTIAMILVGMLISAGVGNSGGIGDGSFIAPLTGIGNVGVAQVIIGLGMLLSIPAILEKVPGWFGAGGKGGLAELGNAWGPAMAGAAAFTSNNPLSKRLMRDREERKANEEAYLKEERKKAHLKDIKAKYGDLEPDMPPPNDPDVIRRAESIKRQVRNSVNIGQGGTPTLSGHFDSKSWLKGFDEGNEDVRKKMLANLLYAGNVNLLKPDDYADIQALMAESARDTLVGKLYGDYNKIMADPRTRKAYNKAKDDVKKKMEWSANVGSSAVGRVFDAPGLAAKLLETVSKAGGAK